MKKHPVAFAVSFWLCFCATTILLVVFTGCATKVNGAYCDGTTPCITAERPSCDLVKHECEPASDLGQLPPVDLGELDAARADLAAAPDLRELPDLQSLPDLTPLPDLAPYPTTFVDDVQPKLVAGGCAGAACHDINAHNYAPFLIPSPAPGANSAEHANYLSFSAEAQNTVMLKLIAGSGTSHGAAVPPPGCKPCSDVLQEPCATLGKWYIDGKLEVRP